MEINFFSLIFQFTFFLPVFHSLIHTPILIIGYDFFCECQAHVVSYVHFPSSVSPFFSLCHLHILCRLISSHATSSSFSLLSLIPKVSTAAVVSPSVSFFFFCSKSTNLDHWCLPRCSPMRVPKVFHAAPCLALSSFHTVRRTSSYTQPGTHTSPFRRCCLKPRQSEFDDSYCHCHPCSITTLLSKTCVSFFMTVSGSFLQVLNNFLHLPLQDSFWAGGFTDIIKQ